MRNEKVEYCENTGKYCYSSEAKATRALNRYEEIQRVYLCPECEKWHTTSMGVGLALIEGLIEPPDTKVFTIKNVKKRMKKLKRKIKKDENNS